MLWNTIELRNLNDETRNNYTCLDNNHVYELLMESINTFKDSPHFVLLVLLNCSHYFPDELRGYLKLVDTEAILYVLERKDIDLRSYYTYLLEELASRDEFITKNKMNYRYEYYTSRCLRKALVTKKDYHFYLDLLNKEEDYVYLGCIICLYPQEDLVEWYLEYQKKYGYSEVETIQTLVENVSFVNKAHIYLALFQCLSKFINLSTIAECIITDTDCATHSNAIIYLFQLDHTFDYNYLLKVCKNENNKEIEDIINNILDQV